MTELICMRGLPGSGKSSIARQYVEIGFVRTNRDDLRASLFNSSGILSMEAENLITKVQQATVRDALASGRSVVVDDMHLRNKYLRPWNEIANEYGADFQIRCVYTPVDMCIERDSARERKVGADVIRDLARKFYRNEEFPVYDRLEPEKPEPVEYDPSLENVVLVDIDGTMAKMRDRSPYDWARVGEDKPNKAVVDLVSLLIASGRRVVFLSGRDGSCFNETHAWLMDHLPWGFGHYWTLLMREAGDQRKDAIVKREIFDKEIRGKYNVSFILDDRDQVVRMWRKNLGLDCFQVDYGEF